jgi:hypothetical protein
MKVHHLIVFDFHPRNQAAHIVFITFTGVAGNARNRIAHAPQQGAGLGDRNAESRSTRRSIARRFSTEPMPSIVDVAYRCRRTQGACESCGAWADYSDVA